MAKGLTVTDKQELEELANPDQEDYEAQYQEFLESGAYEQGFKFEDMF